jgi:Tfp pilus assembly protein PilV
MRLDQPPPVKPLARGRIAAGVGGLRARAAAEDGVTLIEILVSAVILIIIITGAFRAFDASEHFTGFEQQRSQAQAIAQQDEDNLRALPVAQLDGLNKTYTTTSGKTTYTVVSTAQFQSEATGSSACSAHGSADVIKTTSTVSWAAGATSGPSHVITASSIVSTPAGGALIVQILDANGNAVSGTSVTATGPSGDPSSTSTTLTSGPDGCAIFAGLAGGTYTVNATEAGYVDPNGNTTASAQETVVEGTSVPTGFQLDKAGTITGTLTATGANAAGATYGLVDTMTIANQGMAIPGTRVVGTVGTPFTSGTTAPTTGFTNAFPFPSGYTVYGGSCVQNDPATYTGTDDPSYPVNGTAPTIGMPAIKVTVYSGNSRTSPGSASSGRVLTFYDSGCLVTRTVTSNTSGYVDVAAPYGIYNISTARSGSGTVQITGVTNSSSGLTECIFRGSSASLTQTGAC